MKIHHYYRSVLPVCYTHGRFFLFVCLFVSVLKLKKAAEKC